MGKPKTERALKDNEAKAVLRMLRISPQKLNLVAQLIRGKKVEKALAELEFSHKRISGQVRKVLAALLAAVPVQKVALHFHDTRGTALANVLASLDFGVTTFDSSAGGLGGCPYAPGATGNLATEDLLYLLHGLGLETGVSLDAVYAASTQIEPVVGHALPSRYVRARAATTTPAG